MTTTTQLIAKEAYSKIAILFLLWLVFNDNIILNTIFLSLILLIIIIYRNFEIEPNSFEVVSPVSGEVYAIDKNSNEIKIFVNKTFCDNSFLRLPKKTDYKVKKINGLNLYPFSKLASKLNTKAYYDFGFMKLELISGICGKIFTKETNTICKSQRIGIFTQGLAIITIKNSDIDIKIGDKLKAGISPIVKK